MNGARNPTLNRVRTAHTRTSGNDRWRLTASPRPVEAHAAVTAALVQDEWMALPELVRRQVDRDLGNYCETRVSAAVRDQVRLEFEIQGDAATIVERRVPFRIEPGDQEWTRFPIARFRFNHTRRHWTLYWRDRDLRWHVYDRIKPSPSRSALLAEVDRDPTAIFWG